MRQLGELEAVIMDRLWEWGRPALVREVLDDLRKDRPLAYTTVMTVMENLHRKPTMRRPRTATPGRWPPPWWFSLPPGRRRGSPPPPPTRYSGSSGYPSRLNYSAGSAASCCGQAPPLAAACTQDPRTDPSP